MAVRRDGSNAHTPSWGNTASHRLWTPKLFPPSSRVALTTLPGEMLPHPASGAGCLQALETEHPHFTPNPSFLGFVTWPQAQP